MCLLMMLFSVVTALGGFFKLILSVDKLVDGIIEKAKKTKKGYTAEPRKVEALY